MMRYFVFLRISEKEIENLLNIAIYSLNPKEKWGAHVTLAGPYESRRDLPRNKIYEQKISIVGVGQFRSEIQNTVFLRVGAEDLRDIWDKPDYPYNPHMTIYDGLDHNIGDVLYQKLLVIRPFLSFRASKLTIVSSASGEPLLPFEPTLDFRKSLGLPVSSIREAWDLTPDARVDLAALAIKRAKDFTFHRP